MKKIIILVVLAMATSGCATKQYPQAAAVTGEENALFTCQDVKTEIAKVHAQQGEIERIGEFDARTVFGFLGDFGIGNGMAKDSARERAQLRLNELEGIKYNKCQS